MYPYLSKNFKFLLEQKKTNPNKLSKEIDVGQATLFRIENGITKEPNQKISAAIADWAGVGVNDLTDKNLCGKISVISDAEEQQPLDREIVSRSHLIPIKGRGQLGDGGFWEPIENDGYIRWYSDDPDAYVIQGIGDSMTPRVRHKEYVVVEPNKSVMSGDEVFVVTANGRQMVKIFLYGRDGRIYLESVNEEHEKIILDAKDLLTMHYVSGIAKPSSRI